MKSQNNRLRINGLCLLSKTKQLEHTNMEYAQSCLSQFFPKFEFIGSWLILTDGQIYQKPIYYIKNFVKNKFLLIHLLNGLQSMLSKNTNDESIFVLLKRKFCRIMRLYVKFYVNIGKDCPKIVLTRNKNISSKKHHLY